MKLHFNGPSFFSLDSVNITASDMVADVCDSSIAAHADRDIFVDSSEYVVLPGFVDVHVHFREPGFSYKETIATGSRSAARGGYGAVCTMPNLSPVPDCEEHLRLQLDRIKADAVMKVLPYGAITRGQNGKELSDMEALAPYVCGFSDDGRGVDNTALMEEAMVRAKALGKIIAAHCEDGSAPKDSPEAEWHEVERDIKLSDKTGAALHICHISTKETLALIRDAKKSGVNVTCETAPHYLLLSDRDVRDDGRFRMNPPLREEADRLALLEGFADGTIDMIATDHAPHSAEEKSRGLQSLNGIVGLECAFPVLYTELVRKGHVSLERLVRAMSTAPCDRFGIAQTAYSLWDLNTPYVLDPNEFLTMGRSTPFAGMTLLGHCAATVSEGRVAYWDPTLASKLTH
ncbi:MAG: dihydroorotase [Clostridia bacterium]|nr:dihydroorotase [Clostridia bacterium]